MPDWPENNKQPAINTATHLSQFNIPQATGNNAGINFNQLNALGQQQFPQQPQPQQQPFQPPFSSTLNGLKRQRESSDGVSPKNVSSPRPMPRNVAPIQQQPQQQQQPQMQNHVIFPNPANLQPQQSAPGFAPNQIRPQAQSGQQVPQQFGAAFANLPPQLQQRFAAQQNAGALQQLQMGQPQQQQPQVQPQTGQQARPIGAQQSPSFQLQSAANRFVPPQPGQQLGQAAQFNQNQPVANQIQAQMAQNPQLYQQRLLQQQFAQATSPPNAQAGLPQQFQNQAQHPGVTQLSTPPAAETQRSPAMRNLQLPKSANSPHQAARPLPQNAPQQPVQMPLQPQTQHQTTQQGVPQLAPPNQPRPPPGRDAFMQNLYNFMARRGTPIQSAPVISSRQIDLFSLYLAVMKEGGSVAATNKGAWGRVAAQVNLQAADVTIASQLADLYKSHLLPFEEAHQAVKRQMTGNHGRPVQPGQPQQPMQPQISATPHTPQQPHQPPTILPNQTPHQTPLQPSHTTTQGMHPLHMHQMPNGMMPQPLQPMQQQHQISNIIPNHLQRIPPQSQTPLAAGQQRPVFQQTQIPAKVPLPTQNTARKPSVEPTPQPQSRQSSVGKVAQAKKPQYQPKMRNIDTYGGYHLRELLNCGQLVEQLRPSVPQIAELGAVDIHALTMSLRSGLPGELTNALDILTIVLNDTRTVLSLADCWDLLDAMLEVGEDACEILEEGLHAKKRRVSCSPSKGDKKALITFEHYHDLFQSCQGFAEDLDELVNGLEKDSRRLKVWADRLLCITALLRNFSFVEFNYEALAGEDVVRFISRLLRGLEMSKARPFLITRRNNLELARDIVTLLSNVAHFIRLPDIDCAQLIFSFILSFSPDDHEVLDPDVLIFSPYKPGRDAYLPPALDALAKLLVVDRPNKEFFLTLLRATTDKPEGKKFTRGDIFLTKAFGMAVSALPTNEPAQAFFAKDERAALAEQGMLAATALVEMLPNDGELARYWLSAKDNFGARLVRTVFHLATIHDQRHPMGAFSSGGPFSHITRRGMRIVEIMTSRASKGLKDGEVAAVACSKKEQLLGAMLTGKMDGAIVESLWRLHDIEDNAAGSNSPKTSAESPKTMR